MTQNDPGFLISEDQIRARVQAMARDIERDYRNKNPLLVGVLKGSFIFLADLVRELPFPVEIDFLAVSSYGKATETSGEVKIIKDLSEPIEGRHVLLVEDIVDTGLTLQYLYRLLMDRAPASLRIAVFLDKKERRVVEVPIHYIGFEVPDLFLVGYGLDYAEKYRNLKYIRALRPEEVRNIGEAPET